jgi:hypothetical protein
MPLAEKPERPVSKEERKKLAGFFKALRNMNPVFDKRAEGRYTTDQETAMVAASELRRPST